MRPCRPALLLVAAPVLLLLQLPRPAGGADDSDGGSGGGGGGGGIAFTNRARQALYRAGQLALKSHQPQFGVYHLAFVLFDATEARAVVDPRSGGAASKHSQTSIGATVAAAAGTDALEISHKLERAAGREVDSEEPPPTTSTGPPWAKFDTWGPAWTKLESRKCIRTRCEGSGAQGCRGGAKVDSS